MAEARVKKAFSSTTYGNVSYGDVVRGDLVVLRQMEEVGLVEIIGEKKPVSQDLETKPSPSSPAARVLNSGNATTLETKPLPSQSTQATKQHHGQTLSMDATETGGSNTTRKSRRGRKSGRKTAGRRTDSD